MLKAALYAAATKANKCRVINSRHFFSIVANRPMRPIPNCQYHWTPYTSPFLTRPRPGCLQSRSTRSFSLCSSLCGVAAVREHSGFQKFLRLLGKLDYSDTKLKYTGLVLYTKCTDDISYQHFAKYCHLPDTFLSWFLITELHVWMCMVRLMHEGVEGQVVRKSLVGALWNDTTVRSKLVGVITSSKRKSDIEEIHQQFSAALFLYDEGLQSDDKTLANALWRHLLQRECDKPEVLEGLVHYIRKQTLQLESYSREEILLKGNITWVPLPDPNEHDQL